MRDKPRVGACVTSVQHLWSQAELDRVFDEMDKAEAALSAATGPTNVPPPALATTLYDHQVRTCFAGGDLRWGRSSPEGDRAHALHLLPVRLVTVCLGACWRLWVRWLATPGWLPRRELTLARVRRSLCGHTHSRRYVMPSVRGWRSLSAVSRVCGMCVLRAHVCRMCVARV